MTLSRLGGHGHHAEGRRQAVCRRRRRRRGLSGVCVCLDQVKSAEVSTGRRRCVREDDDDDDGKTSKAPFR